MMIGDGELWERARCRTFDPELWFSVADEGTVMGDRDRAEAKAICAECPIRSECLEYVLQVEDPARPFGVWGGLTESERRTLRALRRWEDDVLVEVG